MSDIIYLEIEQTENNYQVQFQVDSFDGCANILKKDDLFVLLEDSQIFMLNKATEKAPGNQKIINRRNKLNAEYKLRKVFGKPLLIVKENVNFSHIQGALEFICGLKLINVPNDQDFIDKNYKHLEIFLQNAEHNMDAGFVILNADKVSDELKPIIDILKRNLAESFNKYAILASVIRFIQTHQKWINDNDKSDSNYVYLPYPNIIKEYLSCLYDVLNWTQNINIIGTNDIDTPAHLLYDALSLNLKTIHLYYQGLKRETSFIADLNENNTPSGLNDIIIFLLKNTNNILVNELKEFKLSTGESLFLVSDFLKNYGYAVSIIPESADGPDYRIGILKEYYVVLRNYLNCPDIDSDWLYEGWKACVYLLNPEKYSDNLVTLIQKHTMWGLYSDKCMGKSQGELLVLNDNTVINIKDKTISEELRSGDWAKGTVDNAKFLIKLLRHHFRKLGIDNETAKIISVLLILGPQTLPTIGLLTSCQTRLHVLQGVLPEVINEWGLSKWECKNRFGNITATYSLNSLTLPRDKVKEISSNNLMEMREILEVIGHILESEKKKTLIDINADYDYYYDRLHRLVIKLGLTEQAAQYLVRLHYNPGVRYDRYATMDGIPAFCASDVQYLRKLIYSGWVYAKSSRVQRSREEYTQYYLTEPLYDILINYTCSHADEIEVVLNDLDVITEFMSNNKDNYCLAFNPKRSLETDNSPQFDEILSQHLKPYINELKQSKDLSIELSLTKPLPSQIRVYLFQLKKCDADNSKHNSQYSIEIKIPGDRVDVRRSLNLDDVDLVLLGGYVPDFDMYVFWNPYSVKDFTNRRPLYVDEDDIYSALVDGMLVKDVRYKVGHSMVNDKIYITTSANLVETIEMLKDKYLDDLLKGD